MGRHESLARLREAGVGRIVFSANCLPAARPVRLSYVDRWLLIALGPEIEPETIRVGDVVALEIDDSAPDSAATWSVSATGVVLEVVNDPEADLPSGPLSWVPAAGLSLLSVSIERIEGHALDLGTGSLPTA